MGTAPSFSSLISFLYSILIKGKLFFPSFSEGERKGCWEIRAWMFCLFCTRQSTFGFSSVCGWNLRLNRAQTSHSGLDCWALKELLRCGENNDTNLHNGGETEGAIFPWQSIRNSLLWREFQQVALCWLVDFVLLPFHRTGVSGSPSRGPSWS